VNSYAKFGGATRRRFFVILKKHEGGCSNTPSGARVKTLLKGQQNLGKKYICIIIAHTHHASLMVLAFLLA